MKRIISVILLAVLLLSSCSLGEKEFDGKISVVSTVFPSYDFARNVGGENVNVTMLIPPGTESHSYEPTPGDIVKINTADLLVCVGGESESWLDKIITSNGKEIKVLRMMECTELLEDKLVEGMEEEEHSHDHTKKEYDEHVWTSPVNAVKISEALRDALCEIDAENSGSYKENCEKYTKKLCDLDSDIRDAIVSSENRTVIFADRFPFRYFAEEYGLKYYAAFPGCSGLSEPGAKTVAFLADKVEELSLPAVFILEFSRGTIAESICERYPAAVLRFHSCHNVSTEDFSAGIGYIELMEENLKNLKTALEIE
ncbi:MAG: zinc ABC transporter substrate-binding protein [Ruminococcaceae bacterium]|nr:zinc ABC transporter substrate-binding protein [Oscillospiraceae bacterium]